ncbi:exodeoxyribonuclease III [Halalkalibacter oceani]|uniref:Exodeoxyribonuclease III n=1 Tax=Halalkalibacter oceani TaxID=1653776 RepID=A0A9X2DNU5_9BACI|nr:exodeoxyribonuclease III [Halalkalibacter oceani]MCM3713911.1 exodeoxyribonuclease III [Halalkalibacter oceani]
MKLVSWNVNGLRACVKKGFLTYFQAVDADIFCIQETKLQEGQLELELPGYQQFFHSAQRKGYSGTAVFTKKEPLAVHYGFEGEIAADEGRVLTLEFDRFYLVNVYTVNAKRDLSRLRERLEWEDALFSYVTRLDQAKPVILTGDMNVAHTEIDLKNARANRNNSGFTIEEREKLSRLLDAGFIDTYRYFYPEKEGAYTWWSYMSKVRERNIGWRIDYFLASERLRSALVEAGIDSDVLGSDHCPIRLTVDLGR